MTPRQKERFRDLITADIRPADIRIMTIIMKCRSEKRDEIDTLFMIIDALAVDLNNALKDPQ